MIVDSLYLSPNLHDGRDSCSGNRHLKPKLDASDQHEAQGSVQSLTGYPSDV
jgi:hypothetical protein